VAGFVKIAKSDEIQPGQGKMVAVDGKKGSEQETVKAYPFIEFAVEASLCGCSGMPKLVSWASMFPD
jgi:hypothetical protein